jgi:hypothetical protein
MAASNFTAVYWNSPTLYVCVVSNKWLKLQVFLVVFPPPTLLHSSVEAQHYTMVVDEFSPSLMYWKANVVRTWLSFCFKLQLIISTDVILMFYYIYVVFCFFIEPTQIYRFLRTRNMLSVSFAFWFVFEHSCVWYHRLRDSNTHNYFYCQSSIMMMFMIIWTSDGHLYLYLYIWVTARSICTRNSL